MFRTDLITFFHKNKIGSDKAEDDQRRPAVTISSFFPELTLSRILFFRLRGTLWFEVRLLFLIGWAILLAVRVRAVQCNVEHLVSSNYTHLRLIRFFLAYSIFSSFLLPNDLLSNQEESWKETQLLLSMSFQVARLILQHRLKPVSVKQEILLQE